MVTAHIDAAIPNFLIQECNVDVEDPFYRDLFDPMPTIRNGYLELPDAPGLGIGLREEAVTKYPRKPYDRPVIVGQDGAIGLE
jgi:galactonate dehydratase